MVSSAPTVVADHQSAHAIPAHMTRLVAGPTYNVSISAAAASPTTPFFNNSGLGAFSSHMPRNITQVADVFILAITCTVTCLPTVLACLVIGTVSCNMTLLEAVIAQPQITRWQLGGCAVSSTVPCLTTGVADALIWTVSGRVTRLSTVPAQ